MTIAVNKADRLTRAQTIEVLEQAVALGVSEDVFPISARTGAGVEALTEHLTAAMPEGPFMFEEGASSDQPRAVLLAELIREAVIKRTFQELPHAVEVIVEEIEWVRGKLGSGAGAGADLGGERIPEGDPGRRAGAHDQGDRRGGAP